MALGMSIASDNLRHSGSVFILLRAVRIRAALLTRTEAESERAESKGRSQTREWVSDGEHAEECVWMRGSVSESINTLGGLEGLPA